MKTDGDKIYFSSASNYYRAEPIEAQGMIMPPKAYGATKIIKAFPPADLEVITEIDKNGNLLLQENILMIFASDKIYGYDISDPKLPLKKWEIELESNNYLVGARLYKGEVYLITRNRINTYHPCPIRPLSINGSPLTVKCTEIYHPSVPVPVDVTYTALSINPDSGDINNTISFIGSSGLSVLYMSENALYVTYSYYGDLVDFIYSFFDEKCQDIIPESVREKLKKLATYDISQAAKMTELEIILEQFQSSLTDDERLRIENEFENRMEDYYKEHKRDLEQTGIVKVELERLTMEAVGNVPGTPLNQFSLDEHNNHLRVAVTVGGSRGIFWGIGESANDVYILNDNLRVVGSVQDMGLEERIYSVRFLGDKGYVVTFKQIDPFFVLDLSDPKNPELKGELKIPGYSSYLHPITDDRILGIGKEGSQVKISLFGVKDPENPKEVAKYTLDEYWSDILNTHHAFLLDKKHEIFFLPGSRGGYIFSYVGDKLKLERAVSNIRARRAIYINDYLYVIGDDKITVLNELDWEKVNELEL